MFHNIETDVDILVMDNRDHVATALRDIELGELAQYRKDSNLLTIKMLDPIPFGHKVAIINIESESEVRKYGEVIGRSTARIVIGQHVHVHNIEGIRGRGDQVPKEAKK